MPDNDKPQPSRQSALAAIDTANLTDLQKRDMRSAVITFCKLVGLRPEQVPAHPPYLPKQLAAMSCTARGLSKGRWSNIKMGLSKAVGLVGQVHPSRNTAPLLPEWHECVHRLPKVMQRKLSSEHGT